MFLLLKLGIRTEYLLKMRLLAEVDATGKAVEGAHSLVYPLVHVPVARRREDLKYKVCGIRFARGKFEQGLLYPIAHLHMYLS
jgi:hypothetical protein